MNSIIINFFIVCLFCSTHLFSPSKMKVQQLVSKDKCIQETLHNYLNTKDVDSNAFYILINLNCQKEDTTIRIMTMYELAVVALINESNKINGFFRYQNKCVFVFSNSLDSFFEKINKYKFFSYDKYKPVPVYDPKIYVYSKTNGCFDFIETSYSFD
jgi:hypothetical protein